MKFRKKPIVIEATQWFKNGDHPKDCSILIEDPDQPEVKSEGAVVRYFRQPVIWDQTSCKHCGKIMHIHGWIDTLEGGYIVCPGDWVITGINGEIYPCKPDIFTKTYEAVKDV